jgi:hypothetical protein
MHMAVLHAVRRVITLHLIKHLNGLQLRKASIHILAPPALEEIESIE